MTTTRKKLVPATAPEFLAALIQNVHASVKAGLTPRVETYSLRTRAQLIVNEDAVIPISELNNGG